MQSCGLKPDGDFTYKSVQSQKSMELSQANRLDNRHSFR
jgi:hypothetical protein